MPGAAGNTSTWDALGSLVQFNGGQNGGGTYLYDVEDRRVAVLKSPDNTAAAKDETYIVRSLAGQTLREFTVTGPTSPATRAWSKDYLYAAGNLLASVKTDGAGGEDIRHYHRDHLGSPRLITDASGSEVGRRTYLPYGEMVTDTASDETHKYTLHERDENFAGTDDDLDYMLARYYSPHLGRFLSCDPERGRAERLQTLNRYAYAWGNPVKNVDPDGRDPCTTTTQVTVIFPDGSTQEYTETKVDEECRVQQDWDNRCNDPVLRRADPTCTSDSFTENEELHGDLELEDFENRTREQATAVVGLLDCLRQATAIAGGKEPFFALFRHNGRLNIAHNPGVQVGAADIKGFLTNLFDQYPGAEVALVAHGHPSGDGTLSQDDLEIAFAAWGGWEFLGVGENGVGTLWGGLMGWQGLGRTQASSLEDCESMGFKMRW